MLTRTPEQIALNETGRLCQEIIDLCSDAADQTSDSAVKHLMLRLIEEHERLRAMVDGRLRALDDLPLTPDPEWEGLKKIATRTKKIFVTDENTVLLDERIADEEKLLSHISDALKLDLSAATRECLQDAHRTATSALSSLRDERKTHG